MIAEARIYAGEQVQHFKAGEGNIKKLDVRIKEGIPRLTIFYNDGSVRCFLGLRMEYHSKDPRRMAEFAQRKEWKKENSGKIKKAKP